MFRDLAELNEEELSQYQDQLNRSSYREELKAEVISLCGVLLLVIGVWLPRMGYDVPQPWTSGSSGALMLAGLSWQLWTYSKFGKLRTAASDHLQALLCPSPTIAISTSGPRSSPQEVNRSVLYPLEKTLNKVRGVKTLSVGVTERSASIRLSFADRTDMEKALGEVHDRIEGVRPQLPEDFDEIDVRTILPLENESPISTTDLG